MSPSSCGPSGSPGPTGPSVWRRRLRFALAAVLGAALLGVLLRQVDWAPLAAAVAATPLAVWLAALTGLGLSYALRAERLRREWGAWFAADPARGAGPGFMACLALFLTHNAAIVLLPLRAGEAGYPLLLKRRFGVPVGDSLRSLLWLRLQDAAVLASFAAWWLPPLAPGQRAAMAAVLAAGWVLAFVLGPRVLAVLAGRLPAVRRFEAAWLTHRNDRAGWALCAANWTLKLAVLGLLLAAFAPLDFGAGVRGALGGELAAVLPLQGPAGLGTYEAGVWAAVLAAEPALRPAGAQIAAGALALHAVSLLVALAAAAMIMPWARSPQARPPLAENESR